MERKRGGTHGGDIFVTLAERLESAGGWWLLQRVQVIPLSFPLCRAARTCLCTVGRAAVAAAAAAVVKLGWAV
jgi:hypothetical protein